MTPEEQKEYDEAVARARKEAEEEKRAKKEEKKRG